MSYTMEQVDQAPEPQLPEAAGESKAAETVRRGLVGKALDSLVNLVQGLGNPLKDQITASTYDFRPVDRNTATSAYFQSWLVRRACDIPAEDMCSEPPLLQMDQSETAEDVASLFTKGGVQKGFEDAQRWAYLYGGAIAVIVTKTNGKTDPLDSPLDVDTLTEDCFARLLVADRWAVTRDAQKIMDPADPNFGDAEFYSVAYWQEAYNVAVSRVHISRILKFYGDPVPGFFKAAFDGWGDTRLTSILKAIKGQEATSENIARVVFDAVVDIIKIPGLATKLSTKGGTEAVLERLQLLTMAKGINKVTVLDGGNGAGAQAVGAEEYVRNAYSFTGLKDAWEVVTANVAGAVRIPLIRFLGKMSSGLNANGDAEMTIYYEEVKRQKITRLDQNYHKIIPVLIVSVDGKPSDYKFTHQSIEVLSKKDQATVDYQKAQTDEIYEGMGAVDKGIIARDLQGRGFYPSMTDDDVEAVQRIADLTAEQAEKIIKGGGNPDAPPAPGGVNQDNPQAPSGKPGKVEEPKPGDPAEKA